MATCACEIQGVQPCNNACSCSSPVQSGGCSRCATYGSDEQRRAAAHRIADRELQVEEYKKKMTSLAEEYQQQIRDETRALQLQIGRYEAVFKEMAERVDHYNACRDPRCKCSDDPPTLWEQGAVKEIRGPNDSSTEKPMHPRDDKKGRPPYWMQSGRHG